MLVLPGIVSLILSLFTLFLSYVIQILVLTLIVHHWAPGFYLHCVSGYISSCMLDISTGMSHMQHVQINTRLPQTYFSSCIPYLGELYHYPLSCLARNLEKVGVMYFSVCPCFQSPTCQLSFESAVFLYSSSHDLRFTMPCSVFGLTIQQSPNFSPGQYCSPPVELAVVSEWSWNKTWSCHSLAESPVVVLNSL